MAQKPERHYSRDEITKALTEAGVPKDKIKEAFTIIMNYDIKELERRRKTFRA